MGAEIFGRTSASKIGPGGLKEEDLWVRG